MSKLPTDKEVRKARPIARGVLDYFPDAIAEIAHVSLVGNQQHNPGEPLHWAREKSTDHADCVVRHLMERGEVDTDGLRHTAKMAWRALAELQTELEQAAAGIAQPAQRTQQTAEVGKPVQGWYDMLRERLEQQHCPPKQVETILAAARPGHYGAAAALTYIAGPMQGHPNLNFQAFDDARDYWLEQKVSVISPADMDRHRRITPPVEGEKFTAEDCRGFTLQDIHVLWLLRPEEGDFVTVLPGWECSTGATAEVFMARWLQLPIRTVGRDADCGNPLNSHDIQFPALCHFLAKYVDDCRHQPRI